MRSRVPCGEIHAITQICFHIVRHAGSSQQGAEPRGMDSNDTTTFRALVVGSRAKDHREMVEGAGAFFESLAEENGFTVEVTDDADVLNDTNLAGFQVFVMLHLAPFDMTPDQQSAVQRFVEGGGGWIGLHAAGLTGRGFVGKGSPYWEWFEDLMGGVVYTPHPPYQSGVVVVEDRQHPVTRNLPERFDFRDEWYEFDHSPRGQVRVLATADESTYTPKNPMGDHPLIWVNEAYRRALYIAIGHDTFALENTNYRTLLRDSLLWAASE